MAGRETDFWGNSQRDSRKTLRKKQPGLKERRLEDRRQWPRDAEEMDRQKPAGS